MSTHTEWMLSSKEMWTHIRNLLCFQLLLQIKEGALRLIEIIFCIFRRLLVQILLHELVAGAGYLSAKRYQIHSRAVDLPGMQIWSKWTTHWAEILIEPIFSARKHLLNSYKVITMSVMFFSPLCSFFSMLLMTSRFLAKEHCASDMSCKFFKEMYKQRR